MATIPEPHHDPAVARGARCRSCPLVNTRSGPVMGEIRPSPLLVVLEAPTGYEVEEGRPLLGSSADLLTAAVSEGGFAPGSYSVTNTILCRPPEGDLPGFVKKLRAEDKKSKTHTPTPQECCAPRLARDIADSQATVLLGVGGEALKALAHQTGTAFGTQKAKPGQPKAASIKKQHGSPIQLRDGRVLAASLHPAFALHGDTRFTPVIYDDLRRAAAMARRGKIGWTEPEFIVDRTAETFIGLMDVLRESKARLTIDIETDHRLTHVANIRCIGIGATLGDREVVTVVPLRRIKGSNWWPPAIQMQVENALRALLDEAPLAGHNLLFDTAVLLRHGLMTQRRKRWMDTMLAHKDTDQSELPHDLGFVAARNYDAPRWKEDADAKSVEGVDDNMLHFYCLRRGSPVVMADGSTRLIEDLVRSRSTDEVLALIDGRIVRRRIYGWHKQRIAGQKWIQISVEKQRANARGIVCTPDHPILTARGWMQAANVLRGDTLFLPERRLTETARQAMLGTLLGDSTLAFSPSYRRRREEAPEVALQGSHAGASKLAANKAATYPDLIRLGQVLPGREITVSGRSGVAGETQTYSVAQSRELSSLRPLVQDADGTRRLHSEALEALGSAGLAWWFMDDGCLQKGGRRSQNDGSRGGELFNADSLVISTQRYPREDVEAAARWLSSRYQGPVYVGADKVIRFSVRASERFAAEIAPFVFPEQRYKLPRDLDLPPFDASLYGAAFLDAPVCVQVADVSDFTHQSKHADDNDTRWCIDVEEAHNFFTPWGLVHNCAKDVLGEMRLIAPLASKVISHGQLTAFKMDSALAPTARDMGDLGLVIDEPARRDIYEKLEHVASARLTAVRDTSGISDFNPNASKEIARFLYVTQGLTPPFTTDGDEWGQGSDDSFAVLPGEEPDEEYLLAHASTNRQSLLKLLELGVDDRSRAFISALMGYRQMEKIKSTFVGLAPLKPGANDCVLTSDKKLRDTHRQKQHLLDEYIPGFGRLPILHTSWKLHVVPSGRWASQPAAQNWPERVVYDPALYRESKGELGIINTRRMVVAPPGHVIVGADYNAIELRLYASHSGDKKLLDAFNSGKDAHAYNFASMMAKHEGEIMDWYERVKALDPKEKKAKRNIAKRFVYLIIYGGQRDKLFKTMAADRTPDGSLAFPGLKEREVAFWFDNWHKAHPETRAWQKRVVADWTRDGFAATAISGRRRYFLGGLDPNAIVNHTIQGTAADIANRAMLRIANECPHRGWSGMSGPILQVHDFIGVQVPLARQKDAEALLESAMPWRDDRMEYGIELKSGTSWADV